jgi:hypothetical protein
MLCLFRRAGILGLGLLVFACGDDSAPADGGAPRDAGRVDSGGRDAARPDAGPRDAGTDAGGPVSECDPTMPGMCGAGMKCSTVIDRTDPENVAVFFGCTPTSIGTAGDGVLCGRGRDVPDATGFETDTCAEGLICLTDGTFTRCRALCGLSDTMECNRETQYCQLVNDEPAFGACFTTDDCDPVAQTGCDEGDACYALENTFDDVVGVCFTVTPPEGMTDPLPAGEPCMFVNNCVAGTQCRPIDDSVEMPTDFECRTLCDPMATPSDCAAAEECRVFTLTGSGMFQTPSQVGVCYPE